MLPDQSTYERQLATLGYVHGPAPWASIEDLLEGTDADLLIAWHKLSDELHRRGWKVDELREIPGAS